MCPREVGTDAREKFELRFAKGLDISDSDTNEKTQDVVVGMTDTNDATICASIRLKLTSLADFGDSIQSMMAVMYPENGDLSGLDIQVGPSHSLRLLLARSLAPCLLARTSARSLSATAACTTPPEVGPLVPCGILFAPTRFRSRFLLVSP